jgi:Skp family chaperone for outer membrane proteins
MKTRTTIGTLGALGVMLASLTAFAAPGNTNPPVVGAPPVSGTPVTNAPPVSGRPVTNAPPVSTPTQQTSPTSGAGDANPPPSTPTTQTPKSANGKHGHAFVPPGTGRLLHQPPSAKDHGYPALPDDVQSLVQKFQGDQTSFITQRQQLLDQMKQASGADRAKVRDQLRDLRNQWQEEQQQLRQQIRDRLQELRAELKNQRDQQLNDVTGGGDGHHQKH